MFRVLLQTLRHRAGRSLVLGCGIVVVATSFVLLWSAAATSQLRVQGAVAGSFRAAYDILVRPKGSLTSVERREGLVRANYLSGIYGGISFKQYAEVKHLRGVAVAAPIANLGYMLPFWDVHVLLNRYLTGAPYQLYRVRFTWSANGMSRYPGGEGYVYYTRRDRFEKDSQGEIEDVVPGKGLVQACGAFFNSPTLVESEASGPFAQEPDYNCYSSRTPRLIGLPSIAAHPFLPGQVGTAEDASFPIAVAAIDPVEEAKLLHLNRAVVAGRYLREDDHAYVKKGLRLVPALASTRLYLDDKLDAVIQRLKVPRGVRVPLTLASPTRVVGFLRRLKGAVVAREAIPLGPTYHQVIANPITGSPYWTTSQTRYRVLGQDRLAPIAVRNPLSVWSAPGELGSGYYPAPSDSQDVQFRRLYPHAASTIITNGAMDQAAPVVVGRFDPGKLPGFSPLSRVPLETYYPPTLAPADAASRRALHGHDLLPTQNLGGYIQQPPLLLLSLSGLRPFLNSNFYSGLTPRERRAPISVIRVRVAGVTGDDALSRERIKVVAQEIHDVTGLDVDITAGSSPHPMLIDLPAGRYGRPPLVLQEGWVKKGVTVAFLNAVDRKSVALFGLILVICAFFLANGALASVRGRRSEIGTLGTLGWDARRVFTVILGELGLVGLVAGVIGAVLASILVLAFSLHLEVWLSVLVVPIAVALALVAGVVPAWRAASLEPLDAIRPPARAQRGHRHVRTLLGVAVVNLRALPGRTLLGAAGLCLGVAALTVLVGIQRAYQGTLVGTLLGNAISVQVRTVDYVSVGLTVVLAAVSVADVIYLNLRERAAEIATLRTVGWSLGHLITMSMLEALGIGLLGSITGAVIGLLVGSLILSLPLTAMLAAGALAATGGTIAALLAALPPVTRLATLIPTRVLAEE